MAEPLASRRPEELGEHGLAEQVRRGATQHQESRRLIGSIHEEAVHLQRLIDDLQELSALGVYLEHCACMLIEGRPPWSLRLAPGKPT